MATKSRFSRKKTIPSISSRKLQSISVDFAGGLKTYVPEQKLTDHDLLVAKNVRMEKIGKYRTRLGSSVKIDAIGRAVAYDQWSTTSLSTVAINANNPLSFSFTQSSSFRLWAMQFMARKDSGTNGVLTVKLYRNNSLVASSSCHSDDLTTTLSRIEVKFIQAPDIVAASYKLELSVQDGTSGNFYVQRAGEALVFRLISATPGGITSVFVANDSGTYTTFFVHNSRLYRATEEGVVTLQNGNLPSGTRKVRFNQAQKGTATNPVAAVRYVPDKGAKPRAILLSDFSETAITGTEYPANNILMSRDCLFYFSAADPNGVFTSERTPDYDNFDAEKTFVADIPAPQCGDDLTAMIELGGSLYFFTGRNKYCLYGEDWQTFTLESAAARKGTYSQESVCADTNYIYYATDDGIYRFNGYSEENISSEAINDIYMSIPHKEYITLELFENRLFVFYSSRLINDSCLVYNLVAKVWESIDTEAYVSATCARNNPSGQFLQGHSRVGVIMLGEDFDASYSNVGAPLDAEVGTIFHGFGNSAARKRITKWRPELELEAGDYAVDCGFAKDYRASVNYAFSINVTNGSKAHKDTDQWEDDTPGTKTSTKPHIPGEFQRIQFRYRHKAAFEPFSIAGHTVTIQMQRLR